MTTQPTKFFMTHIRIYQRSNNNIGYLAAPQLQLPLAWIQRQKNALFMPCKNNHQHQPSYVIEIKQTSLLMVEK